PRGFETAHRAAQTGAPVPYFTYPPTRRDTHGGSLHRRDPHLRVLRDGPGGDHVPEAELTEGVECPGLRERGQLGTGDRLAFTPPVVAGTTTRVARAAIEVNGPPRERSATIPDEIAPTPLISPSPIHTLPSRATVCSSSSALGAPAFP